MSSDYSYLMGSDLKRDGMYLELTHVKSGDAVAEVFYSDVTHQMTFSAYFYPTEAGNKSVREMPLEVVEAFIANAKARLPPVS